jgi:hypothetical protein
MVNRPFNTFDSNDFDWLCPKFLTPIHVKLGKELVEIQPFLIYKSL